MQQLRLRLKRWLYDFLWRLFFLRCELQRMLVVRIEL